MDGTPTRTTPLAPDLGQRPPRRGRPRSLRRGAMAALAAVALALVILASAAILPGSHSGAPRFSVARVASSTSGIGHRVKFRVTKVFGSDIPADKYGTEIGLQENAGENAQGQLISDLSPIAPAAFNGPIAAYRAYAERWSVKLAGAVRALRGALAADDRSTAKADWATAFDDYLHLGAVYGLIPAGLQHRLAAVPQMLGETNFPGLHRIEMGLWTGASPRSLVSQATALAAAVSQLPRVLPHVAISPLDYATRAHEILEDAQRDLLSGAQVPWSGAGVLGTAAGLAATREVISTLVALLQGRDNTLVEVQNWLVSLQQVMNGLRRRNGTWPSLGQLRMLQRERLNGTLAGALSALELVPGTLETSNIAQIPSIRQGKTK